MIYLIARNQKESPKTRETSSLKTEGWSEKDLENYLSNHLHQFLGEDLMVIHQSRPFQPDVDLLALDREGDLWFFELKAQSSRPESILQVMRYSQAAADYRIDDWKEKYVTYREGDASRDLAVEFCERFTYSAPDAVQQWQDRIGRKHHLVIVADGADEEAEAAIQHWNRHGLDIQLWPYRIYHGAGESFQLEFPELYIGGRKIGRNPPVFFLLNTCRGRDAELTHEKWMVKHQAGMASHEPWIWKINRISTGSKVMLYANRIGVAYIGIATAEKRSEKLDTLNSAPIRYVKLKDFKKLIKPITINEIYGIAGQNYPVRATLRQLPDDIGERLWDLALKRI